MDFIRRFRDDCSGGTAIEYGVALALLALLITGGMGYFGFRLTGMLDRISGTLG